MELYSIFFMMAVISILSPGPNVVMTLTNTMRYGYSGAFGGILGNAFGVLVVAVIASTSVGILLTSSAVAINIVKYLSACYLVYLGCRLWGAPGIKFSSSSAKRVNITRLFVEGSTLQLVNPYIIFFFLTIMPQFIDPDTSHTFQFVILAITYTVLIIVIQAFYALFAKTAKQFLVSKEGGKIVNKVGAAAFLLFAVILLVTK